MTDTGKAASVRSLIITLTLLLGLALAQQGTPAGQRAGRAALPVTRVVLYTNGIAYFEHQGTVTGSQELELSIPADDMDDLLQSLVLQDFGGGSIRPVRYASQEPLGRILGSYSLDLSANPTLSQLLSQARGERVTVEAAERVTGTIVNVEEVERPKEVRLVLLTLATDSGLRRVSLAEVRSVRFESEQLQAELEAALTAIAENRGNDEKAVHLLFSGEGTRQVSVGYVREMPVWKTTYRLVLGEDGEGVLQGWAIFDNPTDLDLEDVEVTFVAGQPISFIADLYGPVYVDRPRVEVRTGPQVVPPAYAAGDVAQRAAQMEMDLNVFRPAPAAAPSLAGAGVDAMAQGAESGATFSYRVSEPVTVGRHQSAMIPIVNETVSVTELSLFDYEVLPGSPLRGLRLGNDSDLHLAAGPLTLFDESGFSGSSQIDDIEPGGSRLLTYAVDLAIEVQRSATSEPEEVISVVVANGLVESQRRQRITTDYRVVSRNDEGRLLIVEHPRRQGFELAAPSSTAEMTADSYRFAVSVGEVDRQPAEPTPVQLRCDGDGECILAVVEERITSSSIALIDIRPEQIAFYLENVELTDRDAHLFSQILELQQQRSDLERAIGRARGSIDDIHSDQQRLRQNMSALDRNSSLYLRYLSELEAQEDELDELESEIDRLQGERDAVDRELRQLISSLGGE